MTTPGEYREGFGCRNRVLRGAFERLELYEGKLSRTVLRGLGASNGPRLPGASAPRAGYADRSAANIDTQSVEQE